MGVKVFEIWQNVSETVSKFHKYTIWSPFNVIGEKLQLYSWVFDLFSVSTYFMPNVVMAIF